VSPAEAFATGKTAIGWAAINVLPSLKYSSNVAESADYLTTADEPQRPILISHKAMEVGQCAMQCDAFSLSRTAEGEGPPTLMSDQKDTTTKRSFPNGSEADHQLLLLRLRIGARYERPEVILVLGIIPMLQPVPIEPIKLLVRGPQKFA